MIIDSHTHVDEVEAWGWMDPPELILSLMVEAGIDRAVIMTYRDAVRPNDPATLYVHQAVCRYPDKLIGYVRINPNSPEAQDALDQAMVDFKLKGLKLHPVSYVGFPYGEGNPPVDAQGCCLPRPSLISYGGRSPGFARRGCTGGPALPRGASHNGTHGGILPL